MVALAEEDSVEKILEEHVSFYKKLNPEDRSIFEERVKDFISNTAVNGVGTDVSDTDKILVAASAIIPIFSFPDWKYKNISEVLVYKNTFNQEFSQTEKERNVVGMVGDGAMNNTMIISQQSLRNGFDSDDAHNTAIHEFAHLLDKADGSVDGVPEYLLDNQQTLPWLKRIREEMKHIRNDDNHAADIDPYAGKSEAEFFAVITEYFLKSLSNYKSIIRNCIEIWRRCFVWNRCTGEIALERMCFFIPPPITPARPYPSPHFPKALYHNYATHSA